nr:hypothetical protein [Ardenticatena sp.]
MTKKKTTGMSDQMKTLMTVASVAGTLSGWGMLAYRDGGANTAMAVADVQPTPSPIPTPTATVQPTPTVDIDALAQQELEQLVETLPPLPTLVPPPDTPHIQVRQPAQITIPQVRISAPAPQPQPQAPVVSAPAPQQPVLRSVSAPPPPKTRSSR